MIERKIPNLEKCPLLFPILGQKDRTKENYIEALEKFERGCEESIIKTLSRLNIKAIVKTDPYSLPYEHEVVVELPGESYMNGAYELFRAIRPFVKELLNKDMEKIRFYVFVEVQDRKEFYMMGSVKYHFRYYIH